MNKPLVFNYQDHAKALERIQELEAKVEKQSWEIMRLKEENTNQKIHIRILDAIKGRKRNKKQLLVVDSREKAAAIRKIVEHFDKKGIRWVKSKMLFGDYMDYNNPGLVIDRKQNIAELAKNCTIEHERFRNEIELAAEAGAQLVILVEENRYQDREEWVPVRNIADLLRWSSPHTQVRGEKVYRVLASWAAKYPISVVFCDKRATGREILKILYSGDFEAQKGKENGKG